MKRSFPVLLCAALFCHAPSPRAETSPWPMFRHDVRHTGRTPFTGPAVPAVSWTYNAKDPIAASPVLGHDGTVYFGTGTGPDFMVTKYFTALKSNGLVKWRFPVESGIFSSAAVGPDGAVYFGALDHNLYAVEDSITYPHLRWQTDLGYFIYSSPTLGPDGTIYIGTLFFDVWAIKPDGTSRWRYKTDRCVFSSAALSPDGTVYIGSKDEHLYAFRGDGEKQWAATTGTFFDGYLVDSSPAVGDDGTVYVGTDPYGAFGRGPVPVDRVFYAIRPDGEIKWVFPMKDGAESSPAIGPDGTIYVGSYDGNVYALEDRGDHAALKWKYPTGGWVDASPAVDGCGVVYVGSRDGYLYALNSDGTLRWRFRTDGEIESSPAIDGNGMLYVGTFGGTLYCIGKSGPDAGIRSIESPVTATAESTYTPSVTIASYRSEAATVDVSCSIRFGENSPYRKTVREVAVTGGGTAFVRFPPWTVTGPAGEKGTMSFSTIVSNDVNTYNDTLSVSLGIVSGPSGVDSQGGGFPREFALFPCYPNPFNAGTTISFNVPPPSKNFTGAGLPVRLTIYDLAGRVVRSVLHDDLKAGTYHAVWNGLDDRGKRAASSVYIVSLSSGSSRRTTKIVLMK